jgi:Xaa-Pro aminopeptidase
LALGAFSVYLTFDNHALLLSAYSLFVPPRLAQSTQHQRPAPSFDHLSTHCAHLGPIPSISYRTRLRQLAQALHSLHAGAYIAEPGPSAQYFANSLFEEDVSRLSKHPWLLVVTPDVRLGSDDVHARVMMVVPASDVAHARALLPVHLWQVTWVEWEDDGDPFDLAVRAIGRISKDRAIYVDGMMRHSVVDRLQRAAGHRASVRIAPQRIHRIRERKAREEIELLRCANEVGDRMQVSC